MSHCFLFDAKRCDAWNARRCSDEDRRCPLLPSFACRGSIVRICRLTNAARRRCHAGEEHAAQGHLPCLKHNVRRRSISLSASNASRALSCAARTRRARRYADVSENEMNSDFISVRCFSRRRAVVFLGVGHRPLRPLERRHRSRSERRDILRRQDVSNTSNPRA